MLATCNSSEVSVTRIWFYIGLFNSLLVLHGITKLSFDIVIAHRIFHFPEATSIRINVNVTYFATFMTFSFGNKIELLNLAGLIIFDWKSLIRK